VVGGIFSSLARVAAADGIKRRLDVAVLSLAIYGVAGILILIAFIYALEAGRVALLMWWPSWAAALFVAGGLLLAAVLLIVVGQLVMRRKKRRAAMLSAGVAPMLALAPSVAGLAGSIVSLAAGIVAKHPGKLVLAGLVTGAIMELTRSRRAKPGASGDERREV
jgi:hypothetical protein